MDEVSWRRVLRLVGLGLKGRLAVAGVDRVREAATKGTLCLAIVATDASQNSLDKVVPLLKAKGIRMVVGITSATLGSVIGRDATTVIGIVDEQLAKGIRNVVDAVGA
jgi:ribosomal protein L7Ae-like RNA K-turn-binding protein